MVFAKYREIEPRPTETGPPCQGCWKVSKAGLSGVPFTLVYSRKSEYKKKYIFADKKSLIQFIYYTNVMFDTFRLFALFNIFSMQTLVRPRKAAVICE